MAKNWLSKLQNLEGAVTNNYNPFDPKNLIRTPSPSVNFTFGGKGHGLPRGFGLCLFGPPKGGKTVLTNATIGQLHKDDPEAIVVKYDTEYREQGQLDAATAAMWGIDPERYTAFSTNKPTEIFDAIEHDIAGMCEEGMPLALVVIDSINGIRGRRDLNSDSIDTQQIGDHALTIQEGLKRILPVQRKYRFAVILTCHVRAEMDQLEQKRGNKVKMAAAFGVKHYAEYFMFIEPNRNKEGRTDLEGHEFRDASVKDLDDKGDQTGHKIKARMKDSSCGPKERLGEFTLNYQQGIINRHEEIFLLGKNRGVLQRPNNTTYIFGGQEWRGAPNMLEAIKSDPALAGAILLEVQERDRIGAYAREDAMAELEAGD